MSEAVGEGWEQCQRRKMSSTQKFAYVWTGDLGGWRDRLDELGAQGYEVTGQWPANTGTVFVLTCITGVLTPVGAQPEAGSEQKFYAAELDRDGVCVRCGDMAPSVDRVPDGHRLVLYAEQFLLCPHEPLCAAVLNELDCSCGVWLRPATCVNAWEGAQEARGVPSGPGEPAAAAKTAESERQEPQEATGEAASEGRTLGEPGSAAWPYPTHEKRDCCPRHATNVGEEALPCNGGPSGDVRFWSELQAELQALSVRTEEAWLQDAVNHACDVMSDRLLQVWDEVLRTGERAGVFGGDKLERVAQLLATAALNERDRRLTQDTPSPAIPAERPQGTADTERRYAILRRLLWGPLSHLGRVQALKELDELVWLLREEARGQSSETAGQTPVSSSPNEGVSAETRTLVRSCHSACCGATLRQAGELEQAQFDAYCRGWGWRFCNGAWHCPDHLGE
jgi:hypothetical protein